MRRLNLVVCAAISCVLSGVVYGQNAAIVVNRIDINRAEKIMTQRYQVERETSRLLLDWQTEQQQLQDQTVLYQHEYKIFSNKLKQKMQQQDEVQVQRESLLEQQIQAEVTTQQYQTLLDSGIEAITQIWSWLPVSLQRHLTKDYSQLINRQADLTERMLAMTNLVKKIETFDKTINLHLGEMVLADKRWQTERLYLGLAQAFYRLPDGSEVGIGFPTAQGWQWQAQPALQDTINQAFSIYKQQQAPQLITLPIRVFEERN